jgi:hypothetical protein
MLCSFITGLIVAMVECSECLYEVVRKLVRRKIYESISEVNFGIPEIVCCSSYVIYFKRNN